MIRPGRTMPSLILMAEVAVETLNDCVSETLACPGRVPYELFAVSAVM
jgi:hypothetical protein